MQIGFIVWLLRRLCNACQAKFSRMNIMKKEKLPFENSLLKIIIEIIYIYILYKTYSIKLYMWSANANNNFFILQNLSTCFGPYGPSSSDNYRNDIQYVLFRRISFYCNTSIIFMTMMLIYCFLIYIYTILRQF
jgi:hypothetical protein